MKSRAAVFNDVEHSFTGGTSELFTFRSSSVWLLHHALESEAAVLNAADGLKRMGSRPLIQFWASYSYGHTCRHTYTHTGRHTCIHISRRTCIHTCLLTSMHIG